LIKPPQSSHWCLLHTAKVIDGYSSADSYLAYDAKEIISGDNLETLDKALSNGYWLGYLGYGLRTQLEQLDKDTRSYINTPDYYLARFNHIKKLHSKAINLANAYDSFKVKKINSNMSDDAYLNKVEQILEHIKRGDIYQANLTRKYYGEFSKDYDGFEIYKTLTNLNPAPYSAYFKLGDIEIISSSPEQFLKIADGRITTRPIKGTSPASEPASKLANSNKDKAENLMITDLMRNDLSKSCIGGSVKVDKLYEINSYANVHHMSSTVSGKLHNNTKPIDAILGCFPPGSMTGAPKIKAMELCSKYEQQERGIYSGALGWINADNNSAELSVVIRTLIKKGRKFEFQVGGGIVADSNPQAELAECNAKAESIFKVLQQI